ILQIHTVNMPLGGDVDSRELARRPRGFTAAALETLVRRAGLRALPEDLAADTVPMRLFEKALEDARASVTPEMEAEYERLRERLKQERPGRRRQIGFTVNGED